VTGLLDELIKITHLIKSVLQPFLIKSVVISSCGTKRAIHLIHTTSATVATCNTQHSLDLEHLRLQKMDIGGCALVTVITYFFCDLWRSGAFLLSTLRVFTSILSRSAGLCFSRFSVR